MWVTADDVEAYLTAAEAEEEEAAWDAVYDDVEGIAGGDDGVEGVACDGGCEGLPGVVPVDGGIAVKGGGEGIAGGGGEGGRLVNARGPDACRAGYIEDGVAALSELFLAERQCRHGCLTAAGGGLPDFDGTVMQEQGLVVAEPVAVGPGVEIQGDGKAEGYDEGEDGYCCGV